MPTGGHETGPPAAEPAGPSFIGHRCAGCARTYYPTRPERCPACHDTRFAQVGLGSTGVVAASTSGPSQPPIAYVWLDGDGPLVLGRLVDGPSQVGDRVSYVSGDTVPNFRRLP